MGKPANSPAPTFARLVRARLRSALTVRSRLLALLVLAGLLLAGVGVRLVGGLEVLRGTIDRLANEHVTAVGVLARVQEGFLRAAVAERSLLFQSLATPSAQAGVGEHREAVAAVGVAWREFARLRPRAAGGSSFPVAWAEWAKTSQEVLKILADDTPAARRDAIDLSMSVSKEQANAVDTALDATMAECASAVAAEVQDAAANAAERTDGFYRDLGIGLGVLLVIGLVVVQGVVTPLRRAVRALQACADGSGDLTARLPDACGEVGLLAGAFNAFVEGLGRILAQVRGAADQVEKGSREIAALGSRFATSAVTMHERVDEAEGQAATVTQSTGSAATATHELSASIEEISGNAQRIAAMSAEVRQAASGACTLVEAMGRDSHQIQRVVGLIESIARQTNLLALNASVEAARAGSAGVGFAVVAERVKALAIETAKATSDIGDRIGGFVDRVQQAAGSLAKIDTSAASLAASTSGIAAAVEEQSAVARNFVGSFEQIDRSGASIAKELSGLKDLSQSVTDAAGSAHGAAESLVAAAITLSQSVGAFRL